MGVIGGLNRISSISRAGVSDVVLEFIWGTEMSEATQNTLEKLDLVFLPDEAERPLILHFDPSLDPIMELSFSGEGSRFEGEAGLRRLRRIAELQIKRALEPVKGVAAVRVRGGLEEEIHVLLDEEKLRQTGLSIQNVIDRVAQENINVAGGTIKEGRTEYMVRTLNEFENLEQIEETVVLRTEGRNIRVKDLGRVLRAHREREIITNTDGNESVQIDIYKEADANMVDLADRVTARIGKAPAADADKNEQQAGSKAERSQGLAAQIFKEEGAVLKVVADRSTFIENSINEVRNTALIGGALAILILFLFLRNFKTTAIIGFSIPMSLLITFAPLNLLGVSLNIMSLGGLALGVGMLVDSSIVVLESIFRCQEEGDSVKAAAVRGTVEVRGAVFASTLTSIAVFFPMVFVEGIAGQAFGDLGLAVVISLLASFVVAVFFIPMLASREMLAMRGLENYGWLTFQSLKNFAGLWRRRPLWPIILFFPYFLIRLLIWLLLECLGKILLGLYFLVLSLVLRVLAPVLAIIWKVVTWLPLKLTDILLNGLRSVYPGLIRMSLASPSIIVLLVLLCGWATWFVGSQLENELLPEVHQGEFTFEVRLPVGTPLEETEEVLSRVEESILADRQDIHTLLVTFGYDVTNSRRSDEGEHTARFKVLLEPNKDQAKTEARVIGRLRTHFDDIPDVAVRVVRPVLFSAKTPIEVEIQGDDLRALKQMSDRATSILASLPELADVEPTLKSGAPEVEVVYDRNQITQFNLNIGQVARQVRDMVKGNEATRFNMKDRRVPILVRLEDANRERLEDIGRLMINPGGEHPIPLSAIADLSIGEGPSEVRRIDGQRVALINANIASGSLGAAAKRIETELARQIDWPVDMNFYVTGQNLEWERSRASLFFALALSLFLVYVIMAAQFESLIHPFIIMFTIPLAFLGTVLGLYFLGINLSIVVFLGMIMLAGIVVNNAIVMVDYINTLRRRGLEMREAIVTAGEVRLRPILMTTATTVLGLLPMAFGLGDGAEIRTPMAIAVIFGLISSTALTLVVIPTIYYLINVLVQKLFKERPASAEDEVVTEREVPA